MKILMSDWHSYLTNILTIRKINSKKELPITPGKPQPPIGGRALPTR